MKKERVQKKPLSKKVLALNEQLKRRRGIRDLAKRMLIVCEDDKSAPNYFDALKKYLQLSGTSIQVARSGGRTQPIQVVQHAIKVKERSNETDAGTEPFQEVWCVIDGDYGDKIKNARASAIANQIKLAVSTMCFEYWVLLHFEMNDVATIDCDGVISELKKKHAPNYDKGKFDFGNVVTNYQIARSRAENLRKAGIRNGTLPENHNPCSEVYLLINAIIES